MFYLFILESIGTSELILIGLVALIIFGPRKLPEFAKMLGKAMNEFRRTTDDFKETWAREVDLEMEETRGQNSANSVSDNSIQRTGSTLRNEITAPEIKEISTSDFQSKIPENTTKEPQKIENNLTEKRDWL